MTQPVIAFIGAGNMSGCIISGLIANHYPAEHIIATRRNSDALTLLQKEHGIGVTTDNDEAIRQADVIVMGVKPKDMKETLTSLQNSFNARKPLLISIAVGTTLNQLSDWSNAGLSIIRAMPNTPSQVLEGATSLCANHQSSVKEKQLAERIFSAVGLVEWLPEEGAIHAYTALAGSGPAYLFLFIEALSEAGKSLGIDKEVAERLAKKTVFGAAKLAVVSNKSAIQLREQVTSPNGVTVAALDAFAAQDFTGVVEKALAQAVERSQAMARGE